MGNIKYKGKVVDHLDATDIPDHSNVERVAAILGVQKQSLIDALTSKTIFAQVPPRDNYVIKMFCVGNLDLA